MYYVVLNVNLHNKYKINITYRRHADSHKYSTFIEFHQNLSKKKIYAAVKMFN
jgi:hypothetical protein